MYLVPGTGSSVSSSPFAIRDGSGGLLKEQGSVVGAPAVGEDEEAGVGEELAERCAAVVAGDVGVKLKPGTLDGLVSGQSGGRK
jgi:hypothetical protein